MNKAMTRIRQKSLLHDKNRANENDYVPTSSSYQPAAGHIAC